MEKTIRFIKKNKDKLKEIRKIIKEKNNTESNTNKQTISFADSSFNR